MDNPFESDPILVEVVRNGFVESVHHGRVAVTNPDGSLAASVGAEFAPMYPRVPPNRCRRSVCCAPGSTSTVTCSPWSAPPIPVSRSTSTAYAASSPAAGLDESALQTPPDWPFDPTERERAIRLGTPKAPIAMNCSGKHAGMIATTVHNGHDVATYRDPDHPTQLAVLQTIDDLAHEQATNLATDGCGAPLFALSLYGLARAFGRLAAATEGHEHRVAEAVRQHPEFVSGTRRDELELHRAVPGLIGKAGAEAVYAVGLPDGRGIAIKIDDGTDRARAVAMAGLLLQLGFDGETLHTQASAPVLGHGVRVGEIRPAAGVFSKFRLSDHR